MRLNLKYIVTRILIGAGIIGFGTASFMTPEIKSWIASNTSGILIAFHYFGYGKVFE